MSDSPNALIYIMTICGCTTRVDTGVDVWVPPHRRLGRSPRAVLLEALEDHVARLAIAEATEVAKEAAEVASATYGNLGSLFGSLGSLGNSKSCRMILQSLHDKPVPTH